jgi:hypothetical protein
VRPQAQEWNRGTPTATPISTEQPEDDQELEEGEIAQITTNNVEVVAKVNSKESVKSEDRTKKRKRDLDGKLRRKFTPRSKRGASSKANKSKPEQEISEPEIETNNVEKSKSLYTTVCSYVILLTV